jgi:hypothetical protein
VIWRGAYLEPTLGTLGPGAPAGGATLAAPSGDIQAVPEPGTVALLAAAMIMVAGAYLRRRFSR